MANMAHDTEAEFELQLRGSSSLGTIEIADGVVARIAATAATGVDGVSLESRSRLGGLLGRDNTKSVEVEYLDGDRCSITLRVLMSYGRPMNELAIALQQSVKEAVESMTSRPVVAVNVQIVGLVDADRDDDEGRD